MSQEPIFSVTNHHSAACGEPPHVADGDLSRYRGYFENEYGEQAIFVYDRQTQQGTVWMGDAGWTAAHRVREGVAPDLDLTPAEKTWLRACWDAATGERGAQRLSR